MVDRLIGDPLGAAMSQKTTAVLLPHMATSIGTQGAATPPASRATRSLAHGAGWPVTGGARNRRARPGVG